MQSDDSGNYFVTSLPAGVYTVSVSYTGFENYVAKNVVLNVAEKRGLNIQLKAGSTSTTVTVEAESRYGGHRVELAGGNHHGRADPRA